MAWLQRLPLRWTVAATHINWCACRRLVTTTSSLAPADQDDQLHVTVEPLAAPQHEGISVLSLSRPAARNAIGRRLLRELREAVDLLRQERPNITRAVVLRSTVPGVFCAGADLKERAGMTQAETVEFVSALRNVLAGVAALPMPTIAAVDGLALGGGAELALAADIRVAADVPAVVFGFPETGLGIIPGAGGTQRLPRLLGASRAKELIFTGRRVGAQEAAALGLVDVLAPAGNTAATSSPSPSPAFDTALALAASIASRGAPLALRAAKAAINQGLQVDLGTGLVMEEAYYAQLVPTKDRLEGLVAFAEKRRPVYQGE